jgi:hypothetical protein
MTYRPCQPHLYKPGEKVVAIRPIWASMLRDWIMIKSKDENADYQGKRKDFATGTEASHHFKSCRKKV